MLCLLKCCRVRHVIARRPDRPGLEMFSALRRPRVFGGKLARNAADESAVCRDGVSIGGFKLPVIAAVAAKLHAPQAGSRSHIRGIRKNKKPFQSTNPFPGLYNAQGATAVYVWLRQIISRWDWKFMSVTTFNREGIHVRSEKMKVQQKGDNESV